MEESSFELDSREIRNLAYEFPPHLHEVPVGHPGADVSYLRRPTGSDFREHCWDEGGHSL